MTFEEVRCAQINLDKKLDDYHVLICQTISSEMKIQCFYEKDFTPIKYEELKKIVSDATNSRSSTKL